MEGEPVLHEIVSYLSNLYKLKLGVPLMYVSKFHISTKKIKIPSIAEVRSLQKIIRKILSSKVDRGEDVMDPVRNTPQYQVSK